MVRNLKAKYQRIFCRLKCKKLDPADAIASEAATNTRNNVFSKSQMPKKESSSIFRDLEIAEKLGLIF